MTEPHSPLPASQEDLARLVAEIVPALLHSPEYLPRFFELWQEHGFHITPVHFYQPLPDTRRLNDDVFKRVSSLPGVDLREDEQLRLISSVFPRYRQEYESLPLTATGNPHEFHLENRMFERVDAQLFYCMIREFKPERILEVGSGWSSLLAVKAASLNGPTEIVCIEPYPNEVLRAGVAGITALIEQPVQSVPLAHFERLRANDILFIDSSHVVQIMSDVNYLFLEILPRLAPGVIVHIHDIFLPLEYPFWHAAAGLFWTEQYLLRAFLINNSEFEVLFSSAFMHHAHEEKLRAAFGRSYGFGGSFWMRRRAASQHK